MVAIKTCAAWAKLEGYNFLIAENGQKTKLEDIKSRSLNWELRVVDGDSVIAKLNKQEKIVGYYKLEK